MRMTLPRALFRLLASAIGASIGLSLVIFFVDPPDAPFFLASFGGSAVFLFGISASPAAQPRALFGGHIGGMIVLALVAAIWSRLVPGMVSYPSRWFEPSPPSISWGGWVD